MWVNKSSKKLLPATEDSVYINVGFERKKKALYHHPSFLPLVISRNALGRSC